MNYLVFEPIYQERVWGGRNLESHLSRDLPAGKVIGESWEIVDRSGENSVCQSDGRTLEEIRTSDSEWLMGPNWDASKPFPILVKWLDCQERLSLQVHPPADIAPELGGEPKTENWYIAKCTEEAAVLAGLVKGVTKENFGNALKTNDLEPLVCRLNCSEGDSLFVQSGRLHAIDAGNLILEIQQNSDTTYRVYDWGRVGLDGSPRQLHVEESMASIDFDDFEPDLQHPTGSESILADCDEFRLRRCVLKKGEKLEFPKNEEPKILSIVSGSLAEASGGAAKMSQNLILPYAEASSWVAESASVVLVTDRFV